MPHPLELGLDTFGDTTAGPDGAPLSHAQVIRDVVEEAVLADEVGVDFIGVGEHHRADFAASAPEILLAAMAGRTRRIRLGSAVTVLSSDDPVRVFQRFSTLNAVSNGRAELVVGRGSFTESFPLFGYDLDQYETLFDEKLDLLAALLKGGPIAWQGTTRPPLSVAGVVPSLEAPLRTWVGVGGSPQSVVRTARYGFPMMLAIIGGDPMRFAPYADLYRRAFAQMGQPVQPIGVHSHGYVADTDAAARDELWPDYRRMRDRIGAERGWPPMRRDEFDGEADRGSLYVGSPETVARRMATTIRGLGLSRFDLKYSAGPLSHARLMRSITLYGTRVIPRVRELLADPAAGP